MKLKLATLLTCVALFFVAGIARAQITNVLTFTLTATVQNTNNDVNGITTTKAPIKHSVNTAQILKWLAQDEAAKGNWTSNSFPTGAKLVIVFGNGIPDFQVVNKSNVFLVDVTNILSISEGDQRVKSGKQNDTNSLAAPTVTRLQLITFNFDDTGLGVGGIVDLQFTLQGLDTETTTDTVPSGGFYTETVANKVSSITGDGTYLEDPFVVTGSVSASGKGKLPAIF